MQRLESLNEEERRSLHQRIDRIRELLGMLSFQRGTLPQVTCDGLQQVLDQQLIPKEHTVDLQSLGLAFGDVLSRELGVQWCMVEDEYGRDFALRALDSDVVLFPLTMLSKRVERGECPDVASLLASIRGDLPRFRKSGARTKLRAIVRAILRIRIW